MGLLQSALKLGTFALGGVMAYNIAWAVQQLAGRNPRETLAVHVNRGVKGITFDKALEGEQYTGRHWIEDGIERVSIYPKQRKFDTPILMQHGMWHGAWCWDVWQRALAAHGWESHAHSLPGHAGSPAQTPIERCTLDYYLGFLRDEINRHAVKPVLMGHSMGGALTQWYLKYVGDLPAAVLVAPWPKDAMTEGNDRYFIKADPLGMLLSMLTRRAMHTRSPWSAAKALISPRALITPDALYQKLGPESIIVAMQHMPFFWQPPKVIATPMLLIAGQEDAVLNMEASKATAAHYRADLIVEPGAHNLMMEPERLDTARKIHEWLAERVF